jgi:hypothetical protein
MFRPWGRFKRDRLGDLRYYSMVAHLKVSARMGNLEGQLTHPVLREFHEYWRALAKGNRLPSRSQVDPVEIPSLLPNLFMIDVITGPPEPSFRYRLAGTEITKMYGFEFTAMTVADAFPRHADYLTAAYAAAG